MFFNKNNLGSIEISDEVIASLAKDSALSCYGVVDIADKNINRSIIVKKNRLNVYELNIYIVVAFGVRITEVVSEVQKKVKYDLEKKYDLNFKSINVYVESIKDVFSLGD